MAKTRKNSRRSSILKNIRKTSSKALPLVNKGLTTVGNTTKVVVSKSLPVVEKGVSAVYGSLATGFDLGVKGVKNAASGIKNMRKMTKKRHHRRNKTRRH
jgi:hypothetical protein